MRLSGVDIGWSLIRVNNSAAVNNTRIERVQPQPPMFALPVDIARANIIGIAEHEKFFVFSPSRRFKVEKTKNRHQISVFLSGVVLAPFRGTENGKVFLPYALACAEETTTPFAGASRSARQRG